LKKKGWVGKKDDKKFQGVNVTEWGLGGSHLLGVTRRTENIDDGCNGLKSGSTEDHGKKRKEKKTKPTGGNSSTGEAGVERVERNRCGPCKFKRGIGREKNKVGRIPKKHPHQICLGGGIAKGRMGGRNKVNDF